MARWVEQIRASSPMPVFVYSSAMAQYVMPDTGARRVIDFVDVDSQKWSAYAERKSWPVSGVYRRESAALLRFEREVARRFDASLFVSDAEAGLFRGLAPEAANRVFAVSLGVDCQWFDPGRDYPDPYAGGGGATLCFTGMMDYWPNIDAVSWFAQAVMPRLLAIRSSARFWIVGANPTRAVRALAKLPGVVVTGRVEDTRPYLAHASAVVAPLRIARGMQSKVLEAMAMARPVIASTQAFEGIDAEPERDLLVFDGAELFADAIVRIWSGDRARELGLRARRLVEGLYNWPDQLSRLDAVLARVGGFEASAAESRALAHCARPH
jgi:sugar transferase (PEP-CTERM/EpsH1 system associated)